MDCAQGPADYFGGVITSLYGKFQGEAGRKVGVDAGNHTLQAVTEILQISCTAVEDVVRLFFVEECTRLRVHVWITGVCLFSFGLQICLYLLNSCISFVVGLWEHQLFASSGLYVLFMIGYCLAGTAIVINLRGLRSI